MSPPGAHKTVREPLNSYGWCSMAMFRGGGDMLLRVTPVREGNHGEGSSALATVDQSGVRMLGQGP